MEWTSETERGTWCKKKKKINKEKGNKEKKYMLALGLLMTKHEDGAFIGYDDVDANNVVVGPAVELLNCELAL